MSATLHCPACGKFMARQSHVGGWQCMNSFCGRIVKDPPPAPLPPGWKNEGVGRVLAVLDDDPQNP